MCRFLYLFSSHTHTHTHTHVSFLFYLITHIHIHIHMPTAPDRQIFPDTGPQLSLFRSEYLLWRYLQRYRSQTRLHSRPRCKRHLDFPDSNSDNKWLPWLLADGHQQSELPLWDGGRFAESGAGVPQQGDLGYAGCVSYCVFFLVKMCRT